MYNPAPKLFSICHFQDISTTKPPVGNAATTCGATSSFIATVLITVGRLIACSWLRRQI
jgi:hypothetical protein